MKVRFLTFSLKRIENDLHGNIGFYWEKTISSFIFTYIKKIIPFNLALRRV